MHGAKLTGFGTLWMTYERRGDFTGCSAATTSCAAGGLGRQSISASTAVISVMNRRAFLCRAPLRVANRDNHRDLQVPSDGAQPAPGFFAIDAAETSFTPVAGVDIRLAPRDSATLSTAMRYHFEGGSFASEHEAREAGERLRQALHILIPVFGLSLVVPPEDRETNQLSEEARAKAREAGVELLNGRQGLWVLPDDGIHAEFVLDGHGRVVPSDPMFVLNAIARLWPIGLCPDEQTQRALDLLGVAVVTTSPTARFLNAYLAVQVLVPVSKRSPEAIAVLDEFASRVAASDLPSVEKDSLRGALRHLHDGSFPAAFRARVDTIASPDQLAGVPLREMAQRSIALRNEIAHGGGVALDEVTRLADSLRLFALHLIWSRYDLPAVSFDRPGDRIVIDKMEVRVL